MALDDEIFDPDAQLSQLVAIARRSFNDDGIAAAVVVASAIENFREKVCGKIDELISALEAQTPPDWRTPKKQESDQYVDKSGVQRPRAW